MSGAENPRTIARQAFWEAFRQISARSADYASLIRATLAAPGYRR